MCIIEKKKKNITYNTFRMLAEGHLTNVLGPVETNPLS